MTLTKYVDKIRADFPILQEKVHGKPLVYLDSAATSLKPKAVVDRLNQFYLLENANVHRAAHDLSAQATENFEATRKKVQNFIGAASESEIVFTSGTTASLNLVAQVLADHHLKAGDEIIITEMEHHSNIVPWYLVAKKKNLVLKACKISSDGELDLNHLKTLMTAKTRVLTLAHISNVLGTINPLKTIIAEAKGKNILTVVDAAQSVAFMPINVKDLDCDFLAFSAHKMFGPFGVGVLFAKKEILENLPPYMGGGGMIDEVKLDKITFADAPFRFEAGTPNIPGVIALGTAVDYLLNIGFEKIEEIELDLRRYFTERLAEIPNLKIYGKSGSAIIAFNLKGTHASDVASVVDQMGVAVRAGHHCAQLLMKSLGESAVVRASFGIYNNRSDVDALVGALRKAQEILL